MKQGVVGLKAVCAILWSRGQGLGSRDDSSLLCQGRGFCFETFCESLGLDLEILTQSFGLGLGDTVLLDLFGTNTHEIKIV